MIKTTLTKLKKAYSTLSFAPRALGLETNGKFYKLFVSLMRTADKRTKPDKTEEEEYERGEVLANLMLEPSNTAALYSRGLTKPEALQKSSFLAPTPTVENKQREKSTFSSEDESKQNDLNNLECNCQNVALSVSKPEPDTVIQPKIQVNDANTDAVTQETVLETKNIEPPNSLQNAIPDIVLDKKCDNCLDGKTTDPMLCCPGKENSINAGRVNVNDILNSERTAYIKSHFYDRDRDDSPAIKFFSSYDKNKKPPSTETNSTLDELAKQCLDSPNNKIDERLLKEMKKLGVPQTGLSSENSTMEDNIIQIDVLRKPRKPTEKTEIDVEASKCEHPPLNYADEQRLEFEPTTAEDERILRTMLKNNQNTLDASQCCNVKPPIVDGDKPLLNPFDKRNIKIDEESSLDEKNCNPEAVQLEKTNESLKSFLVNSQNYDEKTDKTPDSEKLSENKADDGIGNDKHIENLSNPSKLIKVSEETENSLKSKQDPIKPSEELTLFAEDTEKADSLKSNQDSTKPSEGTVDSITTSCGAPHLRSETTNAVAYQPKAELDLSKQCENASNVPMNSTLEHQDAPSVADEPHQMYKLIEDKVYTPNMYTPLYAHGVDFQAEGELSYSGQQSVNKGTKERRQSRNVYRDPVPKTPEPLLVFDPAEHGSVKLNIHTNPIECQRDNEGQGPDHNVALIQNLRSLRIRCNVLPTKNTDEKATISLLVEIDAYKQPTQELLPRQQPDATDRDTSIEYLKKIDHITRDKVALTLPEKEETASKAQLDSIPVEKAEIPISEKADIPMSEKAEIPMSEKAEIPISEKADLPLSEKTELPISEKPEIPLTEKAEIPLSEKAEIPHSEKAEIPLSEKDEIPLSEKAEIPLSEKPETPLSEQPEIPLSEMLKRVRLRNRAEYCQQLEQTLAHQLDNEVETITGKCGDKKPRCPPRCPPKKKSRCPSPCRQPPRPACPRPCQPAGPPPCAPPCPKPRCGKKAGNPCCPGAGTPRKGGNPCCPGAGSTRKGNPCRAACSSTPNLCNFSTVLPSIVMNSIVSLVDQRLMTEESELAQNRLFAVTQDAYQRCLYTACFAELYRPHLLPILNICGVEASQPEKNNSNLARDYDPWVPIPCWPEPKKEAKKPLVCPNKGCQIPLPGKNRPPCYPFPCKGFPKRKNSFSIIDLYSSWSEPTGRH